MLGSLCVVIASTVLPLPFQDAGGAGHAPPHAPPEHPPAITLEPRSGSGVLRIRSPLLPDETLDLVACESLLDGTKDFGLYPLKLEPKDWKVENGRCAWTWPFKEGFRLDFSAAPEKDSVLFQYTLANETKEPLEKVQVFLCLPTMGAPSFYPGTAEEAKKSPEGRQARVGRSDYTDLFERLHLWSKGKPFSFASTKLGRAEKRVGYTRKGEELFQWSWFVGGEETFDLPLLAVTSRDGKRSLALGLERAIWACTNCGDGRACVHLLPFLGRIGPGATATVKGRIYLVEGGLDDALARFKKDFPKAARE